MCSIFWSMRVQCCMRSLLEINNGATSLPLGFCKPSYEARLATAGLSSFSDSRVCGDMIISYRTLNSLLTCDLSSLFDLSIHQRLRGHCYKLKYENPKPLFANKFYRTISSTSTTSTPVNTFKNNYDDWISGRLSK